MNERDIWATANLMIKRFGEDAIVESAMRADELSAEGDLDGARIWKLIIASIELLASRSHSGPLH
jgi:hypothetical protein